jgi:thioredoxin-related protein
MFKKYLCVVAAYLPFLALSQEIASTLQQVQGNASTLLRRGSVKTSIAETGVEWIESLNWQQIKEKAKQENKYILVDCYTTWCTPCKRMDQGVFSKKDVGDLLNDKFIAVKVQMDVTKKDPEAVKAWYKDAARIGKEYFVFAYPTQLFFGPQGELVDKITGFQEKDKFISIARASLKPGKKYEDPYKAFLVLKENYQKGKKDYKQFPYMISKAKESGQAEFAQNLVNDLNKHLLTLSYKELLNKNYIDFISKYGSVSNKNSTNNLSRVFYPDGKKVDALMEKKNYSRNTLNSMIQRGYVTEFLEGLKGEGANASVPWDSLYSDIAKQFTKEIAQQNILLAKIGYFDIYIDPTIGDPRALSHFIEFTKKYGVEAFSSNPLFRGVYINLFAWKYCVEREGEINNVKYLSGLLENAIVQTTELRKIDNDCPPWEYIDTYAHLLYKMGENENAVKNEMEAIDIYLGCYGGMKGDEQHQDMLKELRKWQNGEVNFSGSWKLNAEKSQFHDTPGAPGAGSKLVVEQKDGTITFQRNDRPKESLKIDSTSFIELSDADGKTKVSMKLTPNNQGLIETRIYTYPEETTSVVAAKKIRTWTLSADKKTLTIQDHIETTREGLNYDMLLIYERQ